MVRRNPQALAKIEAVRLVAMRAGIKGEHVTAVGARPRDQPVKQLPTVTERAVFGVGHQVIDVQSAAMREHVLDAKTADGADRPGLVCQEGEGETLRLHGADARDEAVGAKMGAKLLHDRKAAGDFGIGLGEADGGNGSKRMRKGTAGEAKRQGSRRENRRRQTIDVIH